MASKTKEKNRPKEQPAAASASEPLSGHVVCFSVVCSIRSVQPAATSSAVASASASSPQNFSSDSGDGVWDAASVLSSFKTQAVLNGTPFFAVGPHRLH